MLCGLYSDPDNASCIITYLKSRIIGLPAPCRETVQDREGII